MTFKIRDTSTGGNIPIRSTTWGSDELPNHINMLAIPANRIQSAKVTTDMTSHILFDAPPGSPDFLRNHVSSVQIANKGGTAALIGIHDGAPSSPDVAMAFIYVPASTTVAIHYPVPLRASTSNAVYFRADAASTIYVSAQGFTSD